MALNRGTINSPATPVNLSSSRGALRRVKKSRGRRKSGLSTLELSTHRSHVLTTSRGRNLLQSTLKSIDNATKITGGGGGEKEKKEREINSESRRVLFLRFDGARSFSEHEHWRIYNGVAERKKETKNGTQ